MYGFSSQKYRDLRSQKSAAVEPSRESPLATERLRPLTGTTADCSAENSHSDDTGLGTDLNSMDPIVALSAVNTETESQPQEEAAEPDQNTRDAGDTDQELCLHIKEKERTSPASAALESPAEPSAGSTEEAESTAAADVEEEAHAEEEKGKAAVPRKKKAKTTSKRRSGRAGNRRWVKNKMWEGEETSRTRRVSIWRGAFVKTETKKWTDLPLHVGKSESSTKQEIGGVLVLHSVNKTSYLMLSQGGKLAPDAIAYMLNQWLVGTYVYVGSHRIISSLHFRLQRSKCDHYNVSTRSSEQTLFLSFN